MLAHQAQPAMGLDSIQQQGLPAMDVDDCLLAGDDSSWRMSDWHWDPKAFRAKPVLGTQTGSGSASCCRKRKPANNAGLQAQPSACGGCKARSAISFGLELNNSNNKALKIASGSIMLRQGQQHQKMTGSSEDNERVHECTCQADGCLSNLMQQSVWHQKSRICDQHMSGIFLKQGKAQQFCQQCGRSHHPDAFDKGRRSCRTQLAKHAARRRKRSTLGNDKDVKSGGSKGSADPTLAQPLGTSQATGCRAASSLAALAQQGGTTDTLLQSLCKSRSIDLASASSQLLEAEHRHTSGASEQSLISQPNFRQLLHSGVEPAMAAHQQAHPQAHDSSFDCMLPAADEKPLYQTMAAPEFGPMLAEQLADDPLQDVLNWDLPEPSSTLPVNGSSFDKAIAFMQDTHFTEQTPFQQHVPLHGDFYTGPNSSSGMIAATPTEAHTGSLASTPYSAQASQMPVLTAPQLRSAHQAYSPSFAAVRLSIKLFNSTPAQLPANLRQQLTGWLNCAPAGIDGYIRPGCVHLTMSATIPSQASDAQPAAGHLRRVVDQLLETPQQDVWHNTTMLVQLGTQAAIVHQGQTIKAWSLATASGTVNDSAAATAAAVVTAAAAAASQEGGVQASCCDNLAGLPSKLPVLQCSQPACLVAGQQQLQSIRLEVQGWSKDCKVVCRAGGRHWEVQLQCLRNSEQKQAGGVAIEILLPSQLPAGMLALEVQRGSFMGPELPLLVAPTLALAQDALSVLQKTVPADRQGLIIDLGFIMSSSNTCPAGASVLLIRSANQLLVRAVQHGLVELTGLLMGVVVKERADVLSRIRGPSGMGLVHLAVRSGSSAVLEALLEPVNASAWQATWRGPGGLTPLHLAALLPDGKAIALQLCAAFGAKQWLTAKADDGITPAQFAMKAGKHALHKAITSIALGPPTATEQHPMALLAKPEEPSSQKRACPAEFVSVVPKKQKVADSWTSSTSSDNSSSSSGEEDSCISEPHVFSQLSPSPLQGVTGFVQSQKQRLAALCRASGWHHFGAANLQ